MTFYYFNGFLRFSGQVCKVKAMKSFFSLPCSVAVLNCRKIPIPIRYTFENHQGENNRIELDR